MKYTITQSRLLYVLSINDRKHQNLLKVGEVFVDNEIADNPSKQVLANAVREILDKRSYMKGIAYNIEYVECTTYAGNTKCYKADDVYRTLAKMKVASVSLNKIDKEDADIWFATDPFEPLSSITEAISMIKAGHGAGHGTIKFRPEQDAAIKATVAHFKKPKGKTFLWNAKMRFGKTLSGLEVAKQMGYKSTLIITHRPVVDDGWNKDFEKIFKTKEALAEYKEQGLEPAYGRRMMDDRDSQGNFYTLTKDVDAGKKILVFFVSMQYLRLSQYVGGKEKHFDPLKKAIMQYDWDFVMVDEAHEGIEAAAGVRVMEKLKKENTRILSLSGTPFNLLDKYEEGEIYTWDYVMEQTEKQKWDDEHFGDPNPYADLPRMQILTFTLPKMVRDEAVENNEIFKFHEFFRVWTEDDKKSIQQLIDNETNSLKKAELQAKLAEIRVDKFIHEGAVKRFLDKLVEDSETSQYPFSKDEFRENFKHTFWLLPGVKEAAALEELLKKHDVFGEDNGMFYIINAAGDGNIEDKNGSALADVEDNIRGNAAKNITKKEYTITLSCGKLTTGVSVPEWTAVLCMKGSENTPAANYMQTIFRVQTHAVLGGRQKSDCYVFDFAPDRALTAVAETAKMAVYAQSEKGKKQLKLTQQKEEEHLQAFIKLCPVLSMDEGEMGKHFSANQIFEKLSNVYIERAVRSGYADNSLYNQEQLLHLTPEQEKALGDVHDLLGSMPASWKPEKITINHQGLGDADGAEQVKYVYYLTNENKAPECPSMSAEPDDNGCPTTDDEGWNDVMNAPTQLFPYLFVSNSRLIEGTWTNFSQPTLWKEWTDPESKKDEAKKKRDEENQEKRARMSVLRGVSIRIPLLVYGAEINDEDGEEITIENFTSLVDDASWEEYMPKGFKKETFDLLKDCFDRSIFTGAAKRIRQMVKEADNLTTEDRINKIATIFSYFHNPDKETVLTPWRVVNMHMSDCLGGWCFLNEEFDGNYTVENQFGENVNAARPVGIKIDENGKVVFENRVTQDVFGDYNARILEINSKTGLYPLYMAYSIFKSVKEPEWRRMELTGERGENKDAIEYEKQAGNDLIIWRDVLQDNIFVVCRTKMAVSITKRTLAGFRKDIRMNVKCYERTLSVKDLVDAGVLKEHLHINKKGHYVYDGKPEVSAKKLLEDGTLQLNEVKLIGKEDEDDEKKKVLYEGQEKVNVDALVASGKLKIKLTKKNDTYYWEGEEFLPCDMINVLRAKPELFQQDIVQGKTFWNVYNNIPTSKNEDINNMKFSAIVGNPPYQIMDGGKTGAMPVYQYFVDTAKKVNPAYVSMIMPSRWYAGGRGLDEFRSDMLNDQCMHTLVDFPKSRDIFPTVDIAGGICYFLRDEKHNGNAHVITSIDNVRTESKRELNQYSIFIRDNIGVSVINKIREKSEDSLENMVLSVSPFGLRSFVRGEAFPFDNSVSVKSSSGLGYINRAEVTKNANLIDTYKIMCGYLNPDRAGVNNSKDGSNVTTKLTVLQPGEVVTETYIILGTFNDQRTALNYASYIKTKFVRFLVLQTLSSMHITNVSFQFVPLQDFSRPWTDVDLYAKYNLTDDEIAYIERLIKPME